MILRKGVIRGGQVVVGEPINLPDGSEITITGWVGRPFSEHEDNDRPCTPEEIAADVAAMQAFEPLDVTFMTEDEQSDDPVASQQWIDDLRSIPPVPEPAEPDAGRAAWDERMRLFNLEAVRKQFEADTP